jgi:23S rRNA pseudouridine1911/1915/1917 synthase
VNADKPWKEPSVPELIVTHDSDQIGRRLDQVLAEAHPAVSRTEIQQAIRSSQVLISGTIVLRPSQRLQSGDVISWDPPSTALLTPATIPLSLLYEDDSIVVVDKPAGLVVHPGAGTRETTLVEALLADRMLPVADDPVRPGIVHRLDRETSGVLVVAKTSSALDELKRQFSQRTARKDYLAVVDGRFDETEGLVDAPIGRNPTQPQSMRVQHGGRHAETAFTVLARVDDHSLLWIRPRTGRTHQIRAHMRYIGHPVRGDTKYGGSEARRMMLHAWQLRIDHPLRGGAMEFCAPVPSGFPEYPYELLRESRSAPRR